MKLFLAALETTHYVLPAYRERAGEAYRPPYILESFFYRTKDSKETQKYAGELLLDSGAFTFLKSKHKDGIDWNRYVDEYAEYILDAHSVSGVVNYFELDIDNVVGYANVRKLRERLENRVGRPSIPVWHRERGKEDYIAMCRDYGYVALGGIAARQIKRREYRHFPWFIDTAHEHGARIHGLGFTFPKLLPSYHFDSVDSSTWLGAKYGFLFQIDGNDIRRVRGTGRLTRERLNEARIINFMEWVRYQQYADIHF